MLSTSGIVISYCQASAWCSLNTNYFYSLNELNAFHFPINKIYCFCFNRILRTASMVDGSNGGRSAI